MRNKKQYRTIYLEKGGIPYKTYITEKEIRYLENGGIPYKWNMTEQEIRITSRRIDEGLFVRTEDGRGGDRKNETEEEKMERRKRKDLW
jgi:hypothetical protein